MRIRQGDFMGLVLLLGCMSLFLYLPKNKDLVETDLCSRSEHSNATTRWSGMVTSVRERDGLYDVVVTDQGCSTTLFGRREAPPVGNPVTVTGVTTPDGIVSRNAEMELQVGGLSIAKEVVGYNHLISTIEKIPRPGVVGWIDTRYGTGVRLETDSRIIKKLQVGKTYTVFYTAGRVVEVSDVEGESRE
jgi:hypothetical protein